MPWLSPGERINLPSILNVSRKQNWIEQDVQTTFSHSLLKINVSFFRSFKRDDLNISLDSVLFSSINLYICKVHFHLYMYIFILFFPFRNPYEIFLLDLIFTPFTDRYFLPGALCLAPWLDRAVLSPFGVKFIDSLGIYHLWSLCTWGLTLFPVHAHHGCQHSPLSR